MRKTLVCSSMLALVLLSGCQQMQKMDFSKVATHSLTAVLQSETGKKLTSSTIDTLLNSSVLKGRLSSLLGNNLGSFVSNFGSSSTVEEKGNVYYMSGSKNKKDSSALMWDSAKNVLSTLLVNNGKASQQTEGKSSPSWPSSIASLASKFM